MKSLKAVWAELFGLFVDDGRFALAILVWVAIAWIGLPHLLPVAWDAAGLFAGLALILIASAVSRIRS